MISPRELPLHQPAQQSAESDSDLEQLSESVGLQNELGQRSRSTEAQERHSAALEREVSPLMEQLGTEQLSGQEERTNALQTRIADLEAKLADCSAELSITKGTLITVMNSKSWKLCSRYRDIRGRLRQSIPLRRVAGLLERMLNIGAPHRSYQRWIQQCEVPWLNKSQALNLIAGFRYKPKISIVMPVHNPPGKLLELAIESVRAQYYENWELCICDDASSQEYVHSCLEGWERRDDRIRVTLSPNNEGIASASNRAIQLARGEFVGFLDQDDELSPSALYEVASLLQEHPDADVMYSDEDKLGPNGKREKPFFKPDWSPEYLLSCMYTCHFGVYRKTVLDSIGGFRRGFDGSQDYDLVLRATEQTNRIHHIPKILYHWRMTAGSTARSGHVKPQAFMAAKRALADHLRRRGIRGEILDGSQLGHYRVRFEPDVRARVSIIIPTRDNQRLLDKCIRSIESKTDYANYEILIVDNQSSEPETKRYFSSLSHKVLRFSGPFNFSRILNHGVKQCGGDYLLFLNDDTVVISPHWLKTMLGVCQQKQIGVVGAKLLFPDNRIQHVGVVLGLRGPAGNPLWGFPRNTWRYFGIGSDMRNCSAVTAACMMVRRRVFEQVGGFDEKLRVAYNDVDFCLRVREAGYRIVFSPDAELYHYESVSRGHALDPDEIVYFQKRWGAILMNDPYYNPNLTLRHPDMGYRI